MRQAVLVGVSALLMVFFFPVALLAPIEQKPEEVMLVMEAAPVRTGQKETTDGPVLQLDLGQEVVQIPLEEYLTGVVLSEMPASFELEALKAQAVAARTFTMRQMEGGKHADSDLCADSSCCQAWSSQEALKAKLGEHWLQYWEKVETAVRQTEGQVLTYNGQLIEAVYFSCSGGTTEEAAAVWGSEVPYLQSVPSTGEEGASKYYTETIMPIARFSELLLSVNRDVQLEGRPYSWFGAVEETAGGGVQTMEIGGQVFSGTDLRTLFGLNSTRFSVAITSDSIVFQVYGCGHRVGMSQYGANAMAKAGHDYEEILQHYYTGVDLEIKTP